MHHLKLVKGLSYSGAVSATQAHPDIFVEDEIRYRLAMESGYFEEIEGSQEGTADETEAPDNPGEDTATSLADMDANELKAYAALNGIDLSGRKKKADILAAITEAEADKAPRSE